MGSHGDSVQPGFTISYKQMDRPAILRFQPQYHPFSLMGRPNVVGPWRTTSIEFDSEVSDSAQSNMSPQIYRSFAQGQKSLGTYLRTLKGSLTKEVQDVIKHFCPKHKAQAEQEKTTQHVAMLSNPLVESIQASHDESITTSESTDSTNTISNPPAAETRSLTALENLNPIEPPTSIPSFPPQNDHNLRLLKIFALVLTVGACFAWICLRCRDPRRRAECLARREERRNKKLYRRAARQHKVKMWFWNLRLKYGLAPSEILSWDEKRTRVIEQETILEHAMADDIRALRNAYRVVSNITAAEEGRNAFTYHSEYSERRRSVSTLPGYESEGTEPPTYEDISGSLEGTAVVDGFRYNPAETEFRSDSSVISTSPRISRDGTSSDFDEKFEPISLEATGPAGSGL